MAALTKDVKVILMATARLVDVAVAAAVFVLLYRILFGQWEMQARYLDSLVVSSAVLAVLHTFFYTKTSLLVESIWGDVKRCTAFLAAWFLFLVFLAFLLKVGYLFSREFSLLLLIGTWGTLILVRVCSRWGLRAIRSRGLNTRSVIIVGAGRQGMQLAGLLSGMQWAGYRILGLFDDHQPEEGADGCGFPILGPFKMIPAFLQEHAVDEIFIALPMRELDRIREVITAVSFHKADVKFVPDMSEFFLLNHSIGEIRGTPVINLTEIPLQGVNRLLKEGLDRFLAVASLALLSPVLMAIALSIKLNSPGPVYFRQARGGWNGKIFQALKFRTMYQEHDAEKREVRQASPGDSRVTPLGRFLRRTSLDELPQLINVVKGEMSLVGPRPHAIEHDDIFKRQVLTYMYRHKVKPGITGWAQVNGWRGLADTPDKIRKRIECDLYYIENWSLGLDFRIMAMTLWKGFINKNAY